MKGLKESEEKENGVDPFPVQCGTACRIKEKENKLEKKEKKKRC